MFVEFTSVKQNTPTCYHPAHGPFDQHGKVLRPPFQGVPQLAVFLEAPLTLQHLLRLGLVVPEIGGGDPLLNLLYFLRGVRGVKDTSAGP